MSRKCLDMSEMCLKTFGMCQNDFGRGFGEKMGSGLWGSKKDQKTTTPPPGLALQMHRFIKGMTKYMYLNGNIHMGMK